MSENTTGSIPKKTSVIQAICDYFSTFCSNLAVIGIGICLYKQGKDAFSLTYALIALALGLCAAIVKGVKK